ncbi:MAG TPA: DUF255 domain-containing protein [Bacteroidia bacterium]|nr:DUF255 domain-containing protein [Bacteroidia bacterium]
MKQRARILLILVIGVVFSSFNYAEKEEEELDWFSWNTGYPKISESKKIGLIDVYTDWCGWCKRMDRDTYSKRSVIERINKNFVPIKFNPEAKGVYYVDDSTAYSGPQLYAMLTNGQSTGFPTTYFLVPNGNVLNVVGVAGYQDSASFAKILDDVLGYVK